MGHLSQIRPLSTKNMNWQALCQILGSSSERDIGGGQPSQAAGSATQTSSINPSAPQIPSVTPAPPQIPPINLEAPETPKIPSIVPEASAGSDSRAEEKADAARAAKEKSDAESAKAAKVKADKLKQAAALKAKNKGKAKKGGKPGKPVDPLTKSYVECKDIVDKLKDSMMEANTMLRQIDTDPRWAWAKERDAPLLNKACRREEILQIQKLSDYLSVHLKT